MIAPPITEKQFQRQVTELAEMLGWDWCHFRTAINARGMYQTPVSGTVGKGWPDLFLMRARDGRRLALELKAEAGRPTPEQLHVIALLNVCMIDAYWFRPRDWDRIQEVLR